MGTKTTTKRRSQDSQGPSKRRKLAPGKHKKSSEPAAKGKDHAYDRGTIPIPQQDSEEEFGLNEEDVDLVDEYGGAAAFLKALDEKGISRSKREQDRLHRLAKPARKASVEDDLPSIASHSDDDEVWSSGVEDNASELDSVSDGNEPSDLGEPNPDSDAEMSYEVVPRKRRPSWSDDEQRNEVDRLPIKLGDGRIQKSGTKVALRPDVVEAESPDEESDVEEPAPAPRRDDVSTGARFGRPAIVDVLETKSRKLRLQAAKEQIAGICQEIVAEPENSLGLLRRLHTFSLAEISTPSHPEPVTNDPSIRKLALLSQLAVFKDIIPGYRIRSLTEKEKAEKVSQMVARSREYEQGLVGVYQNFLKVLDSELKAKAGLEEIALRCMCTLLTTVTHFNFRVNILGAVVARLSKKSWDTASDLCLNTIITLLRADETGEPSLEAVRLLNRMVKERRFNIHPEVLTCLLHLRLKTELGVRASEAKIEREEVRPTKKGGKKGKAQSGEPVHLSKKAKKALKEKKEIQKEMKEAEAEVDKEQRAANQTETLKLLFVLYFRILKNPTPTPLLPAALLGISKFAHLVSVDFFKDLMKVLKGLVSRDSPGDEDVDDATPSHAPGGYDDIRHRLSCIVTAFELLSGQGEALNIDLGDFINQLYSIILSLSLMPDIDAPPTVTFKSNIRGPKPQSTSDLLFRALHLAFSPRSSAGAAPPWRSAAFAKRLLSASLHWPSGAALRALEFVAELMGKDPKLEALLSTEDRTVDGVYRPDVEDPQLCNPFATSAYELRLLETSHLDVKVRRAALSLSSLSRP
ncbi:nucleolar complex-associated protein 3 [Auriscalpium vulgare]|uniref:Nucleolar complex-associated protein 3 n=1 Tax=Auriscalpium vulgare TaxID=40419 RepID=A0ACB8RR91_9AGAM|nr:nucleolar complex-associated protein 3 [Auriscalpium vulgare]